MQLLQLSAAARAVLSAAQAPGAAPIMLVAPVFEVQRPPAPAAAASAGAAQGVPGQVPGGAVAGTLPCTKDELREWQWGLRPFHCGVFPQEKPSVDYAAWWAFDSRNCSGDTPVAGDERLASSSDGTDKSGGDASSGSSPWVGLEATWHDYFEPVGVAANGQLPEWSELFRGYGLNKVQYGTHLASLGFTFQASGVLSGLWWHSVLARSMAAVQRCMHAMVWNYCVSCSSANHPGLLASDK